MKRMVTAAIVLPYYRREIREALQERVVKRYLIRNRPGKKTRVVVLVINSMGGGFGSGGGLVRIEAVGAVIDGVIRANGNANGGSGGGILLVTPNLSGSAPTYIGPKRDWMWAEILRSHQTRKIGATRTMWSTIMILRNIHTPMVALPCHEAGTPMSVSP